MIRILEREFVGFGKRELDDVPLVESAPRYGAADEPATPRLVDTADEDEARSAS